jgi:hypothetical protein
MSSLCDVVDDIFACLLCSEGEELSLGVGAGTRQHRLNKKQSSQGISPASVVYVAFSSKSEVGDSAPEEPPRLSYSYSLVILIANSLFCS